MKSYFFPIIAYEFVKINYACMKFLQDNKVLISDILRKGDDCKYLLIARVKTFDYIHSKRVTKFEKHAFALLNQTEEVKIVCSEDTRIKKFDLEMQDPIGDLEIIAFHRGNPIINPKRAGLGVISP